MRPVSPDVTEAITLSTGHRQGGRITVYKSRVYFDALTSSNAPSSAKDIGYAGKRLNEASFLLARPEIAHQVITAFVSVDGKLYFMREGSDTTIELLSGIDPGSHIGFNANNTTGIYSVYYYNLDALQWEYQNIDIDLLLADDATCLTGIVTAFPELPKGSIYPLVGTENTFVLLDIYEGAVRVRIYDDNRDTLPNKYRFMNPLKVLDLETEDVYLLHKAGAVLVGNKVYVYYSHYDGSVKSMICTLQADMRHGVWSDIRISIPQDLSEFGIVNVFQHNGRIFISGNFGRKEQFSSSTVYSLLIWSDNGLIFTMNRRVLCSLIYLPFHVHTDGAEVVFASTNRIYRTSAPYQIIGENAASTVVDIVNINGSVSSDISATLVAGAEQYFTDEKIDTGSYAKLELSIISLEGKKHVKYFDVVVSGINKQLKDGGRENAISLQTDASWHTENMTHPFYMEFQGKQAIFDKAVDFSNLYKASTGINPDWTLGVDFWGEDGTSFNFKTHSDTSTTHWSSDLATVYAEYPIFGSLENYEFRVYGWSRAGVPDTNPNTDDPTPGDTLNDMFLPIIEYMDDTETKIQYIPELLHLSSAYANPPQTYFQSGGGSYPVVFSVANPGAARKIIRVGVIVTSRSASNTTYYLERVEMPEIVVSCVLNSGQEATFDVVGTVSNILTDTTPETFRQYNPKTINDGWGIGEWVYQRFYTGVTHEVLSLGEMTVPSQIVYIKFINNSTLPIKEIRIHKKVKVLSSTHNGVWLEGDTGKWYKAGETYEYISSPITLEAGATGTGSIYLGHEQYWSGSMWLPDVSSVEASIWITVGSTLSASKDGFFDGNSNAALYSKNWVDPAIGTHYYVYQKIKNSGTMPMTVKAYVETHNVINAGVLLHYRWVSPSKSEDEKTLTWGEQFFWTSDAITIAPGDEKLVYIEGWCVTSNPNHEGYIKLIAYFIDASSSASNPVDGTVGTVKVLTNKRKGIPQILFSTKPYSAWNFETTGRFEFKGDYAHAGLVGLATDEKNFVMGCITKNSAYLAHMKNGKRTILQEVSGTIDPETPYDLRLWHRDGILGFEYKRAGEYWPVRGSIIYYEWKTTDGAVTTNDDIYHLGAYSNLDPPRFRIVGMMSGQSVLAALPIDVDNTDGNSDLINRFPASGAVDIDGVIYNYSGKNIYFADNFPCGPYQLRNIGDWGSPYNRDPDGSVSYQGGKSIECLDFKWLSSPGDYAGAIIATSAGYAWINQQTQWKPWIRTSGVQVLLRNRARFYSSEIPDWYPSTDEKIYITNGLTGLSPADALGNTYMHSHGTFAYFDSGDEVKIHGFGAASGDHDQTIRYLIDVLCSLAGTGADFIGDRKTTQSIADGEQVNLYD